MKAEHGSAANGCLGGSCFLEGTMRVSFKTLMTAGLALAGSMIVQPTPAEAQPYWGPHYRSGWGYRPYAYAPRAYYGPRYYGGYWGDYYGPRRYYRYPYL